MRHFIDIVSESDILNERIITDYDGDGPLYHGTDALSLAFIIESNRLMKGGDMDDHRAGISLTTSEGIAWSFADRSTQIELDNHMTKELLKRFQYPRKSGAVIALDVDVVRRNHRLVHYVDPHTFYDEEDGDEEEIRALGREIAPLEPAMLGFMIADETIEWYKNLIMTEDFWIHQYTLTRAELLMRFDNLRRHSKVKLL